MMRVSQILPLCLFVPIACGSPEGQANETPYAGLEHRAIKALAPSDVEAYLNGDGMGYALAAELNHYPGPKHVLELADRLGMSETQTRETRLIFQQMSDSAKQLGRQIVDLEQRLDRFFAEGGADSTLLQAHLAQIAAVEGALRFRHLAAHLSMRRLLSPEQIARYDSLRGYGTDGAGSDDEAEGHVHGDGAHPPTHEPR